MSELHCEVVIFQQIHGYSMEKKRSQAQHACKRISSRSQTMHTFRSLPSESTCFQVGCQAELEWNLGESYHLVTWLVGQWWLVTVILFCESAVTNNLRNYFMTLMKKIQINVRSLVGLNMDLSCKTNEFETKQVFDLCTWIINGNYYMAASGILTSPEFIYVYSHQLYASSSKFNTPGKIVWVGSTVQLQLLPWDQTDRNSHRGSLAGSSILYRIV